MLLLPRLFVKLNITKFNWKLSHNRSRQTLRTLRNPSELVRIVAQIIDSFLSGHMQNQKQPNVDIEISEEENIGASY